MKEKKILRTCVGKNGEFIVGVHKPEFKVQNLRENNWIENLGYLKDKIAVDNKANFPTSDVNEPCADIIYEIANPFAFRGTTYINSAWADKKIKKNIRIPKPKDCSFLKEFKKKYPQSKNKFKILDTLPHPLLLALAQASTDSEELVLLAQKSCKIVFDKNLKKPIGLGYKKDLKGKIVPDIYDIRLFEVLVNNRYLPDNYKNVLVLKPGTQGKSEIVGEYLSCDKKTHVFEYLRRNSYIPWGHFASNMANDSIRYQAKQLCNKDIIGMRHLYYQRAFVRFAEQFCITGNLKKRKSLKPNQLEKLRKKINLKLKQNPEAKLKFDNTLWGWNFGFGHSQSGQRLHASHQMIHQQNALIPKQVTTQSNKKIPSFACGDLIYDFIKKYKKKFKQDFFANYLKAIQNNKRTDENKKKSSSLIVTQDDQTVLFVPKAQISEFELQLMPKKKCGNIFEADTKMRKSLDEKILEAVKTLETLGVEFITCIEFSKRISTKNTDQRLLYSFIPRLPYAPQTFSEAQLRWITGIYPEDFAKACRKAFRQK